MRRRHFLRGLGGVTLGLPFLETFATRAVMADPLAVPRYAVFMRQASGVAQAWKHPTFGGEGEMFWPRNLGALTRASLTADSDRAVSELRDYADRMSLVRGCKYGFRQGSWGHAAGGNQCLTAAQVSDNPSGPETLAMGESIDSRIARELNPGGREPLTLYAGPKGSDIEEVLSYTGPKQRRAAETNPWNAYRRMTGLSGVDPEIVDQIAARRKSVNDLVRDEMTQLTKRSGLSQSDRERLEVHFDSVRDLEVLMSCVLSEVEASEMQAISPDSQLGANQPIVARMHMSLIALAFACDYSRIATLQIGDGRDSARYTIDGELYPRYHYVSHRGSFETGDTLEGGQLKHHKIDRLMANLFKHLLEKLDAYKTPTGSLLDASAAIWLNDLATGPPHGRENLPYVIVGSAGGFLRAGQYIDAGNVTHNKFLNTIGSAVGLRNAAGEYLDDFGDPSLERGLITAMIA